MGSNAEMTTSKKYEIMRGEILDYIRKIGFTPVNVQCGNGYFIFDMGENSVVNFCIKELKGWKFGIWFYSPKDDENGEKKPDYCQFFAQRKLFIDKFKPSASNYCTEIKAYNKDNKFFDNFALMDVRSMLYEMKYHPFISFYKGVAYNDYIDRKSLIWFYIKENWDVKFYDCKKKFNRWKDCTITKTYLNHIKRVLEKKPSIVETVKIIDGDDEGWISYPRYQINVYFNNDSTELDEAMIQEKYFNNKFFDKVVSKECHFSFFNFNYRDENGKMCRYTYKDEVFEDSEKEI